MQPAQPAYHRAGRPGPPNFRSGSRCLSATPSPRPGEPGGHEAAVTSEGLSRRPTRARDALGCLRPCATQPAGALPCSGLGTEVTPRAVGRTAPSAPPGDAALPVPATGQLRSLRPSPHLPGRGGVSVRLPRELTRRRVSGDARPRAALRSTGSRSGRGRGAREARVDLEPCGLGPLFPCHRARPVRRLRTGRAPPACLPRKLPSGSEEQLRSWRG